MIFRSPDIQIGGTDDPYLERWFLIPRNRYFNIYLHRFLRDDDDRALHDHPWVSLSIIVGSKLKDCRYKFKAGLTEIYKDRFGFERKRDLGFGRLTFRKATFAHRLIVRERGTLTIFVTGPRVREWGFHCPRGWRHWKVFTSYTVSGDSTRVGRGCD